MMPRSGCVSFRLLSARLRKWAARAHQAGASGCLRCMRCEGCIILQFTASRHLLKRFKSSSLPTSSPAAGSIKPSVKGQAHTTSGAGSLSAVCVEALHTVALRVNTRLYRLQESMSNEAGCISQ